MPTCTGDAGTVGYTCSYAKQGTTAFIGEQQVDIHGLLQHQESNTTPFYNESQGNSFYINGQPGATDPTTRQLERDVANATVFDSYDGANEKIAQYEADPTAEQLLHFVNADPARTPSFTAFPKGDFFFTIGTQDTSTHLDGCTAGTTAATAATG